MDSERSYLIYSLTEHSGDISALVRAIYLLDADGERRIFHSIEQFLHQPIQESIDQDQRCLRIEIDATDEKRVTEMLAKLKSIKFNSLLTENSRVNRT